MKYLFLICASEAEEAKMTPDQRGALYAEYGAFTQMVKDRGVYLGGNPLHPTSTATTVRVRNGKTLTTDGPFAETREQMGGYYLLNCANLDEALELAAKIPSAKTGSIEVRPILEMGVTATA
ncbi:MAG TPA: YciI family protein [Bryobacteraceae bacterium]|nr:YciI family protein [Bryobacteraceae bacterium]